MSKQVNVVTLEIQESFHIHREEMRQPFLTVHINNNCLEGKIIAEFNNQ